MSTRLAPVKSSTACTNSRSIGSGVRDARAMGIVLRQVALIALITQSPELAHVIAVIEEELREGLDAPEGIAGGRKRRIVVAVQEDHGGVLEAADIGAKA